MGLERNKSDGSLNETKIRRPRPARSAARLTKKKPSGQTTNISTVCRGDGDTRTDHAHSTSTASLPGSSGGQNITVQPSPTVDMKSGVSQLCVVGYEMESDPRLPSSRIARPTPSSESPSYTRLINPTSTSGAVQQTTNTNTSNLQSPGHSTIHMNDNRVSTTTTSLTTNNSNVGGSSNHGHTPIQGLTMSQSTLSLANGTLLSTASGEAPQGSSCTSRLAVVGRAAASVSATSLSALSTCPSIGYVSDCPQNTCGLPPQHSQVTSCSSPRTNFQCHTDGAAAGDITSAVSGGPSHHVENHDVSEYDVNNISCNQTGVVKDRQERSVVEKGGSGNSSSCMVSECGAASAGHDIAPGAVMVPGKAERRAKKCNNSSSIAASSSTAGTSSANAAGGGSSTSQTTAVTGGAKKKLSRQYFKKCGSNQPRLPPNSTPQDKTAKQPPAVSSGQVIHSHHLSHRDSPAPPDRHKETNLITDRSPLPVISGSNDFTTSSSTRDTGHHNSAKLHQLDHTIVSQDNANHTAHRSVGVSVNSSLSSTKLCPLSRRKHDLTNLGSSSNPSSSPPSPIPPEAVVHRDSRVPTDHDHSNNNSNYNSNNNSSNNSHNNSNNNSHNNSNNNINNNSNNNSSNSSTSGRAETVRQSSSTMDNSICSHRGDIAPQNNNSTTTTTDSCTPNLCGSGNSTRKSSSCTNSMNSNRRSIGMVGGSSGPSRGGAAKQGIHGKTRTDSQQQSQSVGDARTGSTATTSTSTSVDGCLSSTGLSVECSNISLSSNTTRSNRHTKTTNPSSRRRQQNQEATVDTVGDNVSCNSTSTSSTGASALQGSPKPPPTVVAADLARQETNRLSPGPVAQSSVGPSPVMTATANTSCALASMSAESTNSTSSSRVSMKCAAASRVGGSNGSTRGSTRSSSGHSASSSSHVNQLHNQSKCGGGSSRGSAELHTAYGVELPRQSGRLSRTVSLDDSSKEVRTVADTERSCVKQKSDKIVEDGKRNDKDMMRGSSEYTETVADYTVPDETVSVPSSNTRQDIHTRQSMGSSVTSSNDNTDNYIPEQNVCLQTEHSGGQSCPTEHKLYGSRSQHETSPEKPGRESGNEACKQHYNRQATDSDGLGVVLSQRDGDDWSDDYVHSGNLDARDNHSVCDVAVCDSEVSRDVCSRDTFGDANKEAVGVSTMLLEEDVLSAAMRSDYEVTPCIDGPTSSPSSSSSSSPSSPSSSSSSSSSSSPSIYEDIACNPDMTSNTDLQNLAHINNPSTDMTSTTPSAGGSVAHNKKVSDKEESEMWLTESIPPTPHVPPCLSDVIQHQHNHMDNTNPSVYSERSAAAPHCTPRDSQSSESLCYETSQGGGGTVSSAEGGGTTPRQAKTNQTDSKKHVPLRNRFRRSRRKDVEVTAET
eukprot:GHVQ01022515.1.p1 GENE.GHVQ01022515.1~~GHVQ01022515.1.p1  ORF type:complete len:1390 (-),score=355.51 GHVQ01022515.1:877-5046(-)